MAWIRRQDDPEWVEREYRSAKERALFLVGGVLLLVVTTAVYRLVFP